jgi:hypothetical protein
MNMRWKLASVAAVGAALAACSLSPVGAGAPAFLRAAVSGELTESYEGSATFHTGTPGPGRQQFQISSYAGTRSGPSFAITRWDGGRLPVGTYPLSLVDLEQYVNEGTGAPRGITLQYFHTGPQYEAQYVAYDGVLEITHSSRNRVAGRFTVSAERYCLRERVRSIPYVTPIGPCTPQSRRLPDAPQIEVAATFSASPLELGVVEFRR